MNKKQNLLRYVTSDFVFIGILIFIVVALFIFLSPKLSTRLLSFQGQQVLNEFINNSKASGLNPQKYWEFREFYSPGNFNFSRDGLEKDKISQSREKIGIDYSERNIDLTFLVFSSPNINSLDMLTRQTDLNKIVDLNKLPKENIIFIGKNSLIYKQSSNIIKIIFLMDNTEMQKANGFFKYTENDKQITQGENWFNITSVTTD